jgi:hypothetical protein
VFAPLPTLRSYTSAVGWAKSRPRPFLHDSQPMRFCPRCQPIAIYDRVGKGAAQSCAQARRRVRAFVPTLRSYTSAVGWAKSRPKPFPHDSLLTRFCPRCAYRDLRPRGQRRGPIPVRADDRVRAFAHPTKLHQCRRVGKIAAEALSTRQPADAILPTLSAYRDLRPRGQRRGPILCARRWLSSRLCPPYEATPVP